MVSRVGMLRGERLGHFALDVEVYLCERDAGHHPSDDVFWVRGPSCNSFLEKKWGEHLAIDQSFAGIRPTVPWHEGDDPHGLVESTPPHLSFTDAEHAEGAALLSRLGIPADGSHVAFAARDSGWLDTHLVGGNWRYHDHRDATIGNYTRMCDAMASFNTPTVRVGKHVNDPLPDCAGVDYAMSPYRTDFGDIYLLATCKFAVVSPSGPAAVAAIFRRPIAVANSAPFLTIAEPIFPMVRFFAPKLYQRDGQTLTVKEIVRLGLERCDRAEVLADAGVSLVENTPQEIAALAVEMHDVTPQIDTRLRDRFWDACEMDRPPRLNVSPYWLRSHADELGLAA